MTAMDETTGTMDETAAVRWTVDTIRSRAAANQRAWDFYQGSQSEVFTDRRIARKLRQYGRSMRVNMARTPITAVLDRLQVDAWTADSDQHQAQLAALADEQDLDGLADEVHEHAEAYGESFVLVWPDGLAERTDTNGTVVETADGIVMSLEDPTTMAVRHDDEHRNRTLFAGRLWINSDGLHRVNIYHTDRLERWVETGKDTDQYVLVPDTADTPAIWPYPDSMVGTVPVFHYRTTRTEHGRPGHADAIPVQSIVDKLVATDMAMVDFAGFPIRWAISRGDPGASAAYDDPELTDPTSSSIATESDSDRVGKLRADPAAFWSLDADAVGEFAPADPATILDRLNHYTRALLSVTDTPLSEWEGVGSNVSGETLKAEQRPLLRKVKRRQGLHGSVWSACLAYALQADGTPDASITVQWADPAELDADQAWTTTAAKVQAGLPLHQALLEHGYTADQLDEWKIDQALLLTPEQLGRLAQQLAQTVPLVLDDVDVRNLLASYGVPIGAPGDQPELAPAGA